MEEAQYNYVNQGTYSNKKHKEITTYNLNRFRSL